jgi:hypothetical protein
MPSTGARIMLFSSGPTTYGPGKVIGVNLKEQMRTHFEINKVCILIIVIERQYTAVCSFTF